MGLNQSMAVNTPDYEDVAEDYDALNKLRNEVFTDKHSNDQWRQILRDFEPSEVYSRDSGFKLYIGGMHHALDVEMLNRVGITRVVNMAGANVATDQEFYGKNTIKCLVIKAEDIEAYDLSQHFAEVSEFLEQAEKDGASVLVHCVAGVSRSVTVSIAYLMKYHDMSFREASKLVHKSRPQAFPNVGFIQNLLELEKELKVKKQKKSSAKI